MLTKDHPNAKWLDGLYRGTTEIEANPALSEEEREERKAAHLKEVWKRISPDLVIHTGGVRLATTGDMAFLRVYSQRRTSLTNGDVRPLALNQILADDHYGIIHGVFRTARGDEIWDRVGMGAWRFEDGLAVEHWELSNGPKWDSFFLAGDPDFDPASGMEFWTKS
jgi:hypothetical protein